jgi:hypothetical protein
MLYCLVIPLMWKNIQYSTIDFTHSYYEKLDNIEKVQIDMSTIT